MNCFHLFKTKSKLESRKKVCVNKDFCNVAYAQYCKSDKAPFIIYTDLESLMRKIDGCKNNPEKSPTTKVSEHIPSRFSMSTMSTMYKQMGHYPLNKKFLKKISLIHKP